MLFCNSSRRCGCSCVFYWCCYSQRYISSRITLPPAASKHYSSYQIITFCREQVYLTLAYFPNNVTAGGSVRLTCVLPLLLVLASFIQPLASIPFIAIGRSWFLLLVMLRSCLFLLILASCFLLLAFKSFEL